MQCSNIDLAKEMLMNESKEQIEKGLQIEEMIQSSIVNGDAHFTDGSIEDLKEVHVYDCHSFYMTILKQLSACFSFYVILVYDK